MTHRVADVRDQATKTMMAILDEFYENENTSGDSVLSQDIYEQMKSDIKGAYDSLIQKFDAAAA